MRTQVGRASVAVVLLAALAACGGSGSEVAAPAPSAATSPTSPAPAVVPLLPEQARRIAAASRLEVTDLPGYADDGQATDAEGHEPDEMLECLGQKTQYLAHASSPTFARGGGATGVQVLSTALVLAEADSAAAHVRALSSSGAPACFARTTEDALVSDIDQPGVRATTSGVERLPLRPIPGADGAYGFRAGAAIVGPEATVRFRAARVGATVGRVQVAAIVLGGGQSFPADAELERVLRVLVDRAVAIQADLRV